MISFLELNGVHLEYTQDELVELGVGTGSGKIGYDALLEWIHKHKN